MLKDLLKPALLFTVVALIFQACKDDAEKTLTVTYDLNGGAGTAPASQTFKVSGNGITLHNGAGLTKTGFTFGGWAEKAGTNVAITSPYTPASDVTLYAIWTPVYTVTYNLNKGSGTLPAPQTYTQGGTGLTLNTGDGLSRPGFTFGGWAETSDGKTPITGPFKPSRDMAVYAIWNAISYTVSYNLNGGTGEIPASQTYTQGDSPITLNNGSGLVKTGSTFSGWSAWANSDVAVLNPYTPTANITLYAIWVANTTTYTITYNINGGTGTTPENQTYTVNGDPLSLRTAAGFTKSGFTFGGWAISATGTTAVSNPFTPAGNTALFAIWTQSTSYTVSYNINGGTGNTPPAQTYSGTAVALNDGSGLTKTNFTFSGWGDGTSSTTAVANPFTPTRDITLYAIWTAANTYTITYNINGGTGTTPENQTYTVNGNPVSLRTAAGFTKSGFTFGGWAVSATGTTVVSNPFTPAGNTALFAIWTQSTSYTVSYNINGGTGNTPPAQTYSGTAVALNDGSGLTKTNFTFSGWGDGTGSTTAVANPFTPTRDITLYAIWTAANTYTITYNINGGTGTTPENQTYTVNGNPVSLRTAAGFTKSGFTFGGWAVSATGTTAVSNPFTPAGNTALFAIWTQSTYTVSYNINGGTGNTPPAQTYSGTAVALNDGSGLTKTNFTFSGWGDGTSSTTAVANPFTPTRDITLYAIWTANTTTYTISYNINGGTGTTPENQTYNGTALLLNNGNGITKSGGVVFQGWAATQGGTTSVDNPYTPAGNVTLFAIWSTATSFALTAKSTSFTDNSTTDPLKIRHAYLDASGSSPGSNTSPGFNWTQAPTKWVAKYIMVCYDISAGFFHFYYEMPTSTTGLNEGNIPQPDPNNQQGVGHNNYQGPWPVGDPNFHDYQFRIYAVKAGYTISSFTGSHTDIMTNNADYIMGYSNIITGKFKY